MRSEHECATRCLTVLDGALDWDMAAGVAAPWIVGVRHEPAPLLALETLLQEYPISTAEGAALMRIAEGLLRVPDRETAIALTADQLQQASFDGHAGRWIGKLSARALALSKTLLPGGGNGSEGLLGRIGSEAVVSVVLRAVQMMGRHFVLGETIGDAMSRAADSRSRHSGFRFSYDMLGEGARTAADATHYLDQYLGAIEAVARGTASAGAAPEDRDGISIKLSALFPRYEDTQRARVMDELVPRVWQLADRAARAGINLTMDAEEGERLELSLDVLDAVMRRAATEHGGWRGLGLAVQSYQTRALDTVDHVVALARRHHMRLMVRLVKGAYWDAEIKRAQVLGLAGYPVYTHKHHSDLSYLACARTMLAAPDALYPQFASHNAVTIAAVMQLADRAGAPFEFQRLHGMGEAVYEQALRQNAAPCRVYAPVGHYRDLLAYLVRRLLENAANSSFLHQLADPATPVDALIRSPLTTTPVSSLPLPATMYGDVRRNSAGLDVAHAADRERLFAALGEIDDAPVTDIDEQSVPDVVARLRAGFGAWSERPVAERSRILERAANRLESRMPTFCARIVTEAHKTWDDAVAEVREAVDFLRYYAAEARRVMAPLTLPGPTGELNQLRLRGRGVWVAISPWNFPLAIFTGQVAAALVTGNTVAAKPAEQTPGVAAAMVDLLHDAGVPRDALVFCPGQGETVGAALVANPGVSGVVFTGSTAVARAIARTLVDDVDQPGARLRPLVPLIAETGGINAMIADTTALAEQVTDAVVASAFRSAGQRCSALRLLCLHEETADEVLRMLAGAVEELTVGDPGDPATDVGPVIDADARERLEQQIARIAGHGRLVAAAPMPAGLNGHYVAPCIYEVADIAVIDEEVFGPVLQVVRWTGDVEALVAKVNALGYGLTLGLQTRLDRRMERVAATARVGNVYVNRSMIGAVVGVQPFGGEGLSGTGPKAGGPHYLPRFCAEQAISTNTAAVGGNLALLATAV